MTTAISEARAEYEAVKMQGEEAGILEWLAKQPHIEQNAAFFGLDRSAPTPRFNRVHRRRSFPARVGFFIACWFDMVREIWRESEFLT